MSTSQNKQAVLRMWDCLYSREWNGLKAELTKDCWFEDIPAPDAGARGPDNIVERLRIGFDLIQRLEHEVLRIAAEDDTVFVEHRERWHFETGEVVENRLASVHELVDGKVSRWHDYWDINSMLSSAPQWWIEAIAAESPRDFG